MYLNISPIILKIMTNFSIKSFKYQNTAYVSYFDLNKYS